jgi:hypothetical protein
MKTAHVFKNLLYFISLKFKTRLGNCKYQTDRTYHIWTRGVQNLKNHVVFHVLWRYGITASTRKTLKWQLSDSSPFHSSDPPNRIWISAEIPTNFRDGTFLFPNKFHLRGARSGTLLAILLGGSEERISLISRCVETNFLPFFLSLVSFSAVSLVPPSS